MEDSALVRVAQALHPEPVGWAFAIGDRDGFRRAHWLDLSQPNWTDRLMDYAAEQGGARLSLSSYRDRSSRAASNVLRCAGVMVDLDGSDLWRFASGELSIVVASGGETSGRRHVHAVRLVEDLDPVDAVPYFRGAAERLGGDPGFSAGVTATVRLPLDPADLLLYRPERVTRSRELHRARSLPPKAIPRGPSADPSAVRSAVDRAIEAVAEGASRDDTGYRLIFDLWSRGLTEDETINVGTRYVEAVEDAKPGDEPYTENDWSYRVGRRYENGHVVLDPENAEAVDRWETGWLADPSTGSSQKTIISALAGRARRAGARTITVSRRQLLLDARIASLPTIERALKGSATRDGLLGKALEVDQSKGPKGAQRFRLLDPPSPPTHTLFPVACYRNAPPPIPSPTVPDNHDAWSFTAIGHGPRCLWDRLVSLDHPANVSELSRLPGLSNCRKTIRRHLQKLADHGLARSTDSGWLPVTEGIDALLDAAAALTERPGPDGKPERLSARLHRRSEDERRTYDPVERQRKERAQLHRVNGRRIAKRKAREARQRRHTPRPRKRPRGQVVHKYKPRRPQRPTPPAFVFNPSPFDSEETCRRRAGILRREALRGTLDPATTKEMVSN